MKEERIDLYSSIISAILGLVGVTSYGTVATVTSVTSYLPGIVASKIKEFNGQMEFNKKVEKEFILALVAAADSTEKHLNQKNAKNLFLLMASEIRNVCQKSDNLEKILYDLNETLSKLQIDLEKQRMYEEWITSNNIKEIMELYFGELNKIISNDYPELGIYLLLIENSESIKKNRQQDIILIDHENRIEEIEKKKMHDIFEIEESVNIILNIIKRYYFKDIKKGSSSLYFLEINNNLFPELTDNIGIKYVDMNSNEIPIFQYVTENWINGNEYINLLLTAEGGMGKTVSLFKCCELLLNQNIMSIYIPLYHMKSIGTDNIEKFIFKYIFRNDKRTFDFFEKYINQSSIDIKLILLLDGFNEVSDNVKNALIREIGDFLLMNNVRLIISSRYDFRYDYGLMHQFKQLSIQQLSKANIEKYLNSCKVEKKYINPALLELLGFPLLISLYAQTEKYYVNAKKMSFIEWYDKVDNAGKIIWNYMQCQILKPLADFENKKIFYLTVCTNYIIPYISWYMISQNIFFLTEEQFILKLNEAINYFKNRWSKKKPLLIEKIELLYIRKKILWDSKYYYRLILNYMHIFNRSVEGEYSLIHHRFRDCFGAVFLINEMNFFNWKILPFQFKDIINEDVLDFIIDLTEKDKVIKIWLNYRNKILEDGSCELKNLYYILYKKCKDEITFENMDLRNVSLCLEQINKRNLCFDGAVLSYDTIVSEEMDSSILCMCVLKKRGICIGGLSDYTVRIWGINYGTFMYVLKGHKGKVTSIAYSPNEKMCLSGSEDCSLILWDIDKGESRFVLTGHESAIVKIEFINNMIVKSFSSDGIIRTWNIEKGICLSITQYNELKVGKNKESNIALLENGNILLNNGMNLIGHKKKVIDYEILPGKNILLSLSLDKSIKVWDTLNGKCQCTLTGFSEWENVIDISFEKKICISGAYDETIRLWDMETGQCKKTMRGHTDFISSLRLTHDATKCISGSYDNTAKIWDLATGECLYTLTGHTQYVRKVECTKDNKFCITASYDGLLKIWEVDTGYLINTLYGHTEGVRAFSLSSDDKYCLSGARDFTAKLWSMESGECIYTFGKHLGHVRSVKIEGEICLTSCTDKKIRKWNIKNGELINTYDLSDISMPNPNIAFCYKEDCVIYFNDGKMIIYNYIENRVIEEIDYIREENHNISDMENIILSPDDKYCVSGSYNSHVVIYNLKEKEYIMKLRAIPYIDIVGTSFYNTCFENEELKNFIFMSGGKV